MAPNRRRVLASAAAALSVSGCLGGGDGDGDGGDDGTPTATEPTTTAETTTESTTTTTTVTTTTTTTTTEDTARTVEVADFSFDPVEISVAPGTEVEWVNTDDVRHDVTSGKFNDGASEWGSFARLDAGKSASFVMRDEGVYEYYCSIHGRDSMCGVILVGDVSPAGPLPCQEDGETDDGETDDGAY